MLKILLLPLLFVSQFVLANTVSCSSDSGLPERTINVPVGDVKVSASTLLYDAGFYIPVYTYRAYFLGNTKLNCNSANGQPVYASRQAYIAPSIDVTPGMSENAIGNMSYIFPTSVNGIGVSFDYSAGGAAISNKLSPLTLEPSFNSNDVYSGVDRVDITLWITPDFKNNINSSARYMLNDGFKFVHSMVLDNASDSFNSVPYPDLSISNGWAINKVNLHLNGSMEIQNSTCDFQNKTVWMGSHHVNKGTQPSPWKDASFTVTCTPAWGRGEIAEYNDAHIYTGTTSKYNDWGFNVMVIPRTDVIDNTRGIIGLKNGGAQGYGIQLAWGKPSAQPTSGEPTDPVLFNSVIFGAFIPGVGFPMFDFGERAQQEFKLSARYVRLPAEAATPGAADASIEVIVTYL